MAKEIERKFIAKDFIRYEPALEFEKQEQIHQAYIKAVGKDFLRVRTSTDLLTGKEPGRGYITTKKHIENGVCEELESRISYELASELIKNFSISCVISKIRYTLNHQGSIWFVDVFQNENRGLVLAEIELENLNQTFVKPTWLGIEVTDNVHYSNYSLSIHPYGELHAPR